MENKGILLRAETVDGIMMLSPEQRGYLLQALFAESGLCEAPALDPITQMAFTLILPSVKRSQDAKAHISEVNSENGRKGGRPRKAVQNPETETETEKPTAYYESEEKTEKPTAFDSESEKPSKRSEAKLINTPPSPSSGGFESDDSEIDSDSDDEPKAERRESEYGVEFERFWREYPRKESKRSAWKAWAKAKKRGALPPMQELLLALTRKKACRQWQKDGGEFIPLPATWINADGWMDEDAKADHPIKPVNPFGHFAG